MIKSLLLCHCYMLLRSPFIEYIRLHQTTKGSGDIGQIRDVNCKKIYHTKQILDASLVSWWLHFHSCLYFGGVWLGALLGNYGFKVLYLIDTKLQLNTVMQSLAFWVII